MKMTSSELRMTMAGLEKSQALIDHVSAQLKNHIEDETTDKSYDRLAIVAIQSVTSFLVSSLLSPQVEDRDGSN